MRAFAGVCSNMLIVVLFTALANKAFTQTVNIPNGINSVNATAGPAPVFFPDMGMLYERSWIPHGPVTDTSLFTMQVQPDMMLLTTAYKDLLGRPWQTVAKQASPGQKDMVQFFTYDKYGRENRSYMPYTATGNNSADGKPKTQVFTAQQVFNKGLYPQEDVFYTATEYDNSPFNEVVKSLPLGNSWGGSNRGVSSVHRANTASDSVRLWQISILTEDDIPATTSTYQPGSLVVIEVTDEQGIKTISYTNQRGETVLTKTQISSSPGTAHIGWLCSYYIYDEMGRLRFVLSPRAVAAVNSSLNWSLSANPDIAINLCYSYWYDALGRLLMKEVPGKGKIYYAYDKQDRLCLSQDAKQRSTNEWGFITYDKQDRPLQTGLITLNGLTAAQVQANAAASMSYPTLTGSFTVLTETYYENYNWTSGTGLSGTMNTSGINASNFVTNYNTAPLYAQPLVQSQRIRGQATGSKTLVLGTSTYLYAAVYYDEDGRAIQSRQTNISGGTDVSTTQYGWNGNLLRSLLQHQKSGAGAQTHTTLQKYQYDHAGRVLNMVQQTDGGTDKTLSSYTYNEAGQITSKNIGNGMEIQDFTYHTRGWLKAINKNYIDNTGPARWFGEEMHYDIGFTQPQYNGNISGVRWKAGGDGTARAYGFGYDNANRLNKADYSQQNTNGAAWTKDKLDFSLSNLTYDVNGNITAMKQMGVHVNSIITLDDLSYLYFANSDQLRRVTDAAPASNPFLGDFSDTSLSTNDYAYDVNGNLLRDNNKHIHLPGGGNGITYNHLDKPEEITISAKGKIEYQYDAEGSLLQKTETDNGRGVKKVISYIAGFVYEKTLAANGNAATVPDTVQYVLHAEGRVRYTAGANPVYDYFLKDHLGNVRTVLTEEQKTDAYPVASLETANLASEAIIYTNTSAGRVNKNTVNGYPSDTYTNPNDFIQRLSAASGQPMIGTGMFLKVMAGDKLNVRANSWYKLNGATPDAPVSPITDLLANLLNGITGASGTKIASGQLTNAMLSPAATEFLNSRDNSSTSGNRPVAWLNVMVFDEQMNLVNTNDGKNTYYEQVGGGNTLKTFLLNNREITKNGYVYIYVSNQTPNVHVYWDNLQVTHTSSPLLQENGYYPFGGEIRALTTNAGGAANNHKFNGGTELNEFFDIDLYETPFRRYDATTGRFTGVDAMAEATMHLTPYQFGANSPVMYNDPTGLLVSGAGYVARPGLQRGVDGYYKAPWEAEFEWNNEGFFDWYNHGVGGGNYSSINGITTKQVLSISPGEVQRYYEKQWAGTGRYVTKVRESPTRSGFDVGYADYSGRSNDVIVGTMFVSTAKMKDHLDGNGSGWDIVAAFTFGAQAEFDFNEGTLHAGGGIAVDLLGLRDNQGVAFATKDANARAAYVRRFGTLEVIKIAGVSYTLTEKRVDGKIVETILSRVYPVGFGILRGNEQINLTTGERNTWLSIGVSASFSALIGFDFSIDYRLTK